MTPIIVLGAIVFLVLVIWSIKRHRDPLLRVDVDGSIAELLPSLAGLTFGTATKSNAVDVLENGAYFDALLAEIEGARRSVHFETFLWKEGAIGNRLADALAG